MIKKTKATSVLNTLDRKDKKGLDSYGELYTIDKKGSDGQGKSNTKNVRGSKSYSDESKKKNKKGLNKYGELYSKVKKGSNIYAKSDTKDMKKSEFYGESKTKDKKVYNKIGESKNRKKQKSDIVDNIRRTNRHLCQSTDYNLEDNKELVNLYKSASHYKNEDDLDHLEEVIQNEQGPAKSQLKNLFESASYYHNKEHNNNVITNTVNEKEEPIEYPEFLPPPQTDYPLSPHDQPSPQPDYPYQPDHPYQPDYPYSPHNQLPSQHVYPLSNSETRPELDYPSPLTAQFPTPTDYPGHLPQLDEPGMHHATFIPHQHSIGNSQS